MFDKFSEKNHIWFRLGHSFVNLYYCIRICCPDDISLLIEFSNGNSVYKFEDIKDRDECLEKIWNLLEK